MDQSWAAQQYMKVDPDACSGDKVVTLDHTRYCWQTMFTVNKEFGRGNSAKRIMAVE